MKARKSKANAHASGVGFYSYMRAKGYPQYQSESVDEVISPRFFFCLPQTIGLHTITNLKIK